ncbi:Hypothetical predicted protein [Olea europaea subsp. europaea]|nr:Hypothetical predicted protein [Olea europaea subsp. europaea]
MIHYPKSEIQSNLSGPALLLVVELQSRIFDRESDHSTSPPICLRKSAAGRSTPPPLLSLLTTNGGQELFNLVILIHALKRKEYNISDYVSFNS